MTNCTRTFVVKEKSKYDIQQYKEKVFVIDLEQQLIMCHVKNKAKGIKSINLADIKSIDPEKSDDILGFTIVKYDGAIFHYKALNIADKWRIIRCIRHCKKSGRFPRLRSAFDEEENNLFFCLMLSTKNKPSEWCFVYCTSDRDICCYSDMTLLNLRLEIAYASIIEIKRDSSAVHVKYKESDGQRVVSFTSTSPCELEGFHVAIDPLKKVLINQIN